MYVWVTQNAHPEIGAPVEAISRVTPFKPYLLPSSERRCSLIAMHQELYDLGFTIYIHPNLLISGPLSLLMRTTLD
jgi:hypothetical protein